MNVIMLCGPPGSGKTTYRTNLPPTYEVLSLDEIVLKEATLRKKTLADIWEEYVVQAEFLYQEQLISCIHRDANIIIDKTHLDGKSRRKTLLKLPEYGCTKIAVYFPAYTPEILDKRIKARADRGEHSVPSDVVKSMYARYQLPQKSEGFDLVVSSSHFLDIMKVMDFK